MTNRNYRLHLGCANTYYPDYINIDFKGDSVADLVCDVRNLPYQANSVSEIVANHLLEHFDFINCKYLLSEWFGVLKPEGRLILETPDLTKAVKKFRSGDIKTKISTLNWIYGIDQEGLQHKTGFSVNLLRHLLTEIGFHDIRVKKPRTHQYESGIRVECSKPLTFLQSQLLAIVRNRVRKELSLLNTSHLTYLESEIFNKLHLLKLNQINNTNKTKIYPLIARLVIVNPNIAQIFLEEVINFDLINENHVQPVHMVLNHLKDIYFHQKVYTLWIKAQKNTTNLQSEYQGFVKHLQQLLNQLFARPESFQKRVKFISSLVPEDIPIFTLYMILEKSHSVFSQGIKHFSQNRYEKAIKSFSESTSINPFNFLAYWNLGRLGIITKQNAMIKDNYQRAFELITNKEAKNELQREIKLIKEDRNLIPKVYIFIEG